MMMKKDMRDALDFQCTIPRKLQRKVGNCSDGLNSMKCVLVIQSIKLKMDLCNSKDEAGLESYGVGVVPQSTAISVETL
jgi:hypothetical protein